MIKVQKILTLLSLTLVLAFATVDYEKMTMAELEKGTRDKLNH